MSNKTNTKPLDFLLTAAYDFPLSPAIHMSGQNMNYKELLLGVKRRAGFLKAHGVVVNSKVAVYTDNDLEMAFTIFALWTLGAVCIPINITQTFEKIKDIEAVVSPDMGFYSTEYNPGFSRGFPMHIFSQEGEEVDTYVPANADDLAMIMFTSGTSGVPKAVPMTHRAITHNAWETSARLNVRSDDRLFINTPPYTTSSIIHMLTMLARGASIVSERRFLFGRGLVDQLKEHKCTGFGGVPVHFSRLLAALENGECPEDLRFLMNSGDHLPVPVVERLRAIIPSVQIYCVYGLTEVAGRFCILDPDALDQKIGSVGLPLDGMKVTIRDEEGNSLVAKEEGEVYVEGPNLMSGYINNPEINSRVMKPYGFATGDFGFIDEDGYLFLRGRKDDIFKVGGEKVSINIIEEAIVGFDEFEDFAVASTLDENMGNVPCLYFVLKKDEAFHQGLLRKYLKKRLPSNHMPLHFVELREIPRTSSGKPIRSRLE